MTKENQSEEDFEVESTLEEPETPSAPEPRPGEVTITLRRWHLYAFIMPLIFVVGLILGFFLRGWFPVPGLFNSASNEGTSSQQQSVVVPESNQNLPAETPQVVRYDVPVDDDPFLGSEDAPITIIEFSDYECPYCRQWHAEVYSQLLDTYGDQIRFVYRDFPLESIHVNAKPAAEAANCANEQGFFWEYHDKLFSMDLELSPETYLEYANQLGMDEEAFQECFESGRYQQEVQSDFDFAANLGVRSTPTFFINGIAVVGAQPFEIFQQVIEKELAGEIP
ncbi:MAG: thioredoxin domain-containing protein [Chloroflexota bacterium]|nr:MAG: thioredoxin domain-containing protein [Chloroflexota bacterium]